jgi:glycosyltransferase involved in cell wall biosynthesis
MSVPDPHSRCDREGGLGADQSSREILILGTTISASVLSVAEKIATQRPELSVVVGVPEVETWKFDNTGFEVLVLGEEQLPFASSELHRVISNRGFLEIILPVGVPRGSLSGVAGFLRSMPDQRCTLHCCGLNMTWRPIIEVILALVTLFVWIPFGIIQRLSFAVDGLGVIVGGLVARIRSRREVDGCQETICHVIPSLGTGGTQRQLVEYLRRSGSGPPVRVIALFDSGSRFLDELESSGIEPEIIAQRCRRSRIGWVALRFFPNTTALVALFFHLRSTQPGCVVSWLFQANVIVASAARMAGVPRVISSVRNMSTWKSWPEFRRWWYWLADRIAAPLNDVIFANSQAAADDFVNWTGLEDQKIEIVHNGLDIDALIAAPWVDIRCRHGLPNDVPILLTVGRLSFEKDHETLLRSCAQLAKRTQSWHLVVAGHGVLETDLRQLADDLGLRDRITFAGRVDDPQSYYRGSTLFVLSSRIEGMPNALIEAQVFGLAAVTTDCGGARDVVEDGRTGSIVPVGDIEALALAIEELLTENEIRERMASAAAASSRQRFGIRKMVVAINELSGRTESATGSES